MQAVKSITQVLIPHFTPSALHKLKDYRYQASDHSITTWLFTPFWDYLHSHIPTTVAPNVLTLAGFAALLASTAFTTIPALADSVSITTNAAISFTAVTIYQTMDALDGKQARKINNVTPTGELLDHVCDTFATALITYNMAYLHGITGYTTGYTTMYLAHLLTQLFFLRTHLQAINPRNPTIHFPQFAGPGEALLLIEVAFFLRAINRPLPIHLLSTCDGILFLKVANFLTALFIYTYDLSKRNLHVNLDPITEDAIRVMLVIPLSYICYTTSSSQLDRPERMQFAFQNAAFFWPLFISEIILIKMTQIPFSPIVPIISLTMLANNQILIILTSLYLVGIFYYLLRQLQLPFLAVY